MIPMRTTFAGLVLLISIPPAPAAEWPMRCLDFPQTWSEAIATGGNRVVEPGRWTMVEDEHLADVTHYAFAVGATSILGEVLCGSGYVSRVIIVMPTGAFDDERTLAQFAELGGAALTTMGPIDHRSAAEAVQTGVLNAMADLEAAEARGEAEPTGIVSAVNPETGLRLDAEASRVSVRFTARPPRYHRDDPS